MSDVTLQQVVQLANKLSPNDQAALLAHLLDQSTKTAEMDAVESSLEQFDDQTTTAVKSLQTQFAAAPKTTLEVVQFVEKQMQAFIMDLGNYLVHTQLIFQIMAYQTGASLRPELLEKRIDEGLVMTAKAFQVSQEIGTFWHGINQWVVSNSTKND